MNPIDTYELREAVRAILDKYGLLDKVQLEFDLMSAFAQYMRGDDPAKSDTGAMLDQREHHRRQATLAALTVGMGKNAQMEADWNRLFGTTPNWQTKSNSELMVWMKQRAEHGETLDHFAEWWFANDWRGKQGGKPSTNQVRELWGLAFTEGGKPQGTQPAFPQPEGL